MPAVNQRALYLVSADVPAGIVAAWNAFHDDDHAPLVAREGGFVAYRRYAALGPDFAPQSPARLVNAYLAPGRDALEAYLGGEVSARMRAHVAAFEPGRGVPLARETYELGHAVGPDGFAAPRPDELAPAAFVVRVAVDEADEAAWLRYYDEEHMPDVVRAGGFVRATRFAAFGPRVVEGRARHLALYEARDVEVVRAFRAAHGARFGGDHEARFGRVATIERAILGPTR